MSLYARNGKLSKPVSLYSIQKHLLRFFSNYALFVAEINPIFIVITYRFHTIYSGTGVSYKIAKLSENRCYKVRLYASNDAGQGPYSQLYEFKTAYAHPPPLKGKKHLSYST